VDDPGGFVGLVWGVDVNGEVLAGGLELDVHRPSCTPTGPQGSNGEEEVGVGGGDEVDPELGAVSDALEGVGKLVGGTVGGDDAEDDVVGVVTGRSGVLLTVREDVGRIQ